jgi:hypothetical protein
MTLPSTPGPGISLVQPGGAWNQPGTAWRSGTSRCIDRLGRSGRCHVRCRGSSSRRGTRCRTWGPANLPLVQFTLFCTLLEATLKLRNYLKPLVKALHPQLDAPPALVCSTVAAAYRRRRPLLSGVPPARGCAAPDALRVAPAPRSVPGNAHAASASGDADAARGRRVVATAPTSP